MQRRKIPHMHFTQLVEQLTLNQRAQGFEFLEVPDIHCPEKFGQWIFYIRKHRISCNRTGQSL